MRWLPSNVKEKAIDLTPKLCMFSSKPNNLTATVHTWISIPNNIQQSWFDYARLWTWELTRRNAEKQWWAFQVFVALESYRIYHLHPRQLISPWPLEGNWKETFIKNCDQIPSREEKLSIIFPCIKVWLRSSNFSFSAIAKVVAHQQVSLLYLW